MFGPKIVEEVDSKFSGKLRVIQGWGYKYVTTGPLTQSGGLVRDVWQPILKNQKSYLKNHQSCLILGLATGTAAEMLAKINPRLKITGVEIDPAMVDLGEKYFNLRQIPNLKIVVTDANSYIMNHSSCFDIILVDLYLGDKLPDFVYNQKFLGQLRKLGKLVIINHLFYDQDKREKARNLIKQLETIFPSVTLKRVLTNLMIACEA